MSCATVDRDDVALFEGHRLGRPARFIVLSDRDRLLVIADGERRASSNARLAHATRYDSSVTCHPPPRREDSTRGFHPVDVFRGRLDPDEDDRFALTGAPLRFIRVEHDLALCGARTRGKAA